VQQLPQLHALLVEEDAPLVVEVLGVEGLQLVDAALRRARRGKEAREGGESATKT
jgi:hypothetical protein